MKPQDIIEAIDAIPARSAWARGVKQYAIEAVEYIAPERDDITRMADILNGARDEAAYSEGGSALIWDKDIAERLCSPSELRRKDGGRLHPNEREEWIDVQTRAVHQAFAMIFRIISVDK